MNTNEKHLKQLHLAFVTVLPGSLWETDCKSQLSEQLSGAETQVAMADCLAMANHQFSVGNLLGRLPSEGQPPVFG